MKKLLAAVTLALASFTISAQSYEVGAFGGAASYNGDLSESLIIPSEINASGGIFGRLNINEFFSLRGGVTYGRLSGDDANNSSPGLQSRNLSFRNDIVEFGVYGEFNFMELNYYYNTFTPYIFAGLTGFYHNPQAQYQGEWVDLQPLSTEGQGTSAFPQRQPYSLAQVAVPMGVGVKFLLGDNVIMGFEAGVRKTFTDYIDDVSKTYVDPAVLKAEKGTMAAALSNRSVEKSVSNNTKRGSAQSMDSYWFSGISIAFRFGGSSRYGFLRADKSEVPDLTAGKF